MNTEKLKDLFGPIYDILFQRKKISKYWGGAFNGQEIRRQIFKDICACCNVAKIYETGSFRGNTTLFMQENGNVKVYSIESSPRFYRYAKLRFLFNPNIKVYKGDSREKLRDLIVDDSKEAVFFYLDAHWREDLPLAEEIEIIFSRLSNAIILIDDFKVENDEGYRYDDYGPGKALNLDYLKDNMRELPPVFFPISSAEETGSKCGCVVITNNLKTAANIEKSQVLYRYH